MITFNLVESIVTTTTEKNLYIYHKLLVRIKLNSKICV